MQLPSTKLQLKVFCLELLRFFGIFVSTALLSFSFLSLNDHCLSRLNLGTILRFNYFYLRLKVALRQALHYSRVKIRLPTKSLPLIILHLAHPWFGSNCEVIFLIRTQRFRILHLKKFIMPSSSYFLFCAACFLCLIYKLVFNFCMFVFFIELMIESTV